MIFLSCSSPHHLRVHPDDRNRVGCGYDFVMLLPEMFLHGPPCRILTESNLRATGNELAVLAFVDDGKDWRAVVMIVIVDEAGIEGHLKETPVHASPERSPERLLHLRHSVLSQYLLVQNHQVSLTRLSLALRMELREIPAIRTHL